jgi:hypothetical protein
MPVRHSKRFFRSLRMSTPVWRWGRPKVSPVDHIDSATDFSSSSVHRLSERRKDLDFSTFIHEVHANLP